MSPQIACLRRGISHWLHLFDFSHCVFANVSSKHLHNRIHNHIGCICLTFPHCAFSNVASNGLHEKRHSCIGCICVFFLRCAFSNVSSNCLPLMTQSRIDNILLTWWHCHWFYSGSFQLSHLHPWNQSHNWPLVLPLPMYVVLLSKGCFKLRDKM